MANQNDTGLGSGLGDPSGIGGLTGAAGSPGGSTGFDSTRSTTGDSGSFGTSGLGAGSMSDGSSESSQDAASRAKELASNLRSRATEKVEDRLSEQKYRAADSLGNIAQQLRSAGEQLPQDNGMGRYINQAAGQVDNFASFLNNRDVADLMDEVEQLARRQPAVFIGGAFALGILGARFLKSSRRNLPYDYQDRWSANEPRQMLDMPRDSVSRPNAPGYASSTDNTSTGYGATGSGTSGAMGSAGLTGADGKPLSSSGSGSSGMGSGYGSTGSGSGNSGYGASGTSSGSGLGTSGSKDSGLGGTGSGNL